MSNDGGTVNVDYLSLKAGEEPDPSKWVGGGVVEVWFYEGSLYFKLTDRDGNSCAFDMSPELIEALIRKAIREDEECQKCEGCEPSNL